MIGDMDQAEFDIASLPRILNFNESQAPLLERIHQRIIEAAKSQSVPTAEAVVNTYHALAQAHVKGQLEETDLPKSVVRNLQAKARLGILIKIAEIWHEAGVIDRCIKALDHAIHYAHQMRWPSIVKAIEIEKHKLQNANT